MEEILEQVPSHCIKVVLYGPESTGKTTLSRKLATHYQAPWVPEYARDYLQQKWDREQLICDWEDMLPIARGQMKLENEAAQKEDRLLICDTDLLETMVYSQAYYDQQVDPLIEKYAVENRYDLYLLTYIDVPWEPDDLRDRPGRREEMFRYFEQALIRYDKPYCLLQGNVEERMTEAAAAIDRLLKK
ncbi:AAA family ATPase [Croceiramulus getboli]|nr:ATP-binding protein [Flavobacteriaceae bacterium YJPT1-3]